MKPTRVVGLFVDSNKLLTMWRYKDGREYRTFIGGTVEENEKVEEALRREMLKRLT